MAKRLQMSESLLLGELLAVAGGYFDAYTYLCRDGVFANAQTGNIVLFGISLSHGSWLSAIRYLLPILAFALGVVITEALKWRGRKKELEGRWIHWRQIIVLVEIFMVAIVAMMPQRMNTVANIIISLVCAMQVESFRKVRGSAFATTMCTGNLRSGTEQLFLWLQNKDRGARKKARHYYCVILFFILGAACGALGTKYLAEKSVLIACIPLLIVFGMMFLKEVDEGQFL